MIAAIYARKSTDQNVVDEAKSVTRQVEHTRAYAIRKGWTVDMNGQTTRLALAALIAWSLIGGCAVARWQVPMTPLRGQSEIQQHADAEACDTEAKAKSGYDRGVEAKTWLWGIPAVTAALVSVAAGEAVHEVTVWRVPEVENAVTATVDAIVATRPRGNPSWGGYFEQYRTCMEQRGYAESRPNFTSKRTP